MMDTALYAVKIVAVILAAIALFLGVLLVFKPKKQASGNAERWSMKYLWAIPIILVSGVVLWAILTSDPSRTWSQALQPPEPSGVWEFAKNYWLWILILGGIIPLVCSFFLPKEKENVAKGLQWFAGLAMALFFVVAPAGSWIVEPSAPPPQRAAAPRAEEIPLASMPQSSWPKLVIPARGRSELVPVPPDMRIMMAGSKFRNHTVYRDGSECSFGSNPCPDGAVVGNYATNEAKEANIVSYAFAPVN